MKKRIFENTQNGYRKQVGRSWLWCLLAGPLYFVFHGAWKHALIMAVIMTPALLIPWFVYPFYAKKLIADSYFDRGWEEVETPEEEIK